MTRQQEMAQQLRDNPLQQRAVYGDVTRSGGYIAAVAVRTKTGIVSAVIEFPTQEGIPMMVLGVLQGLETGGDPCETAKRFIDLERTVMASTMETADTKGGAREKRELDFDRKRAPAPMQLDV